MLGVVTDAQPHRGIHRQGIDVVQGRPPDVGRFAASGRLAAGGAGGQDDGELLADLAVAGIEDHVPGVGVDAGQPGDLAGEAGFLLGLADGGLG